jgi:hypothetical protein
MAFAVMHFLAYLKFMDSHQSAIDIVSTVTWQSILLSYSLISATTPLLEGFTQGFMTAGIALGYSRGGTAIGSSGTTGSYQLRSLTRPKAKLDVPHSMLQDFTKPHEHETLVLGNARQTSMGFKPSPQDCHESSSITSHDSRQIMIMQEWKVTVD